MSDDNFHKTADAVRSRATRDGRDLASVLTDMILADHLDEVEQIQREEATAGYERALACLVARMQANENVEQATDKTWTDVKLAPHVISLAPSKRGQRFVKIICTHTWNNQPSTSVCGFVEVATGLLYKAATYKQPETNYPRGWMYSLGREFWITTSFGRLTTTREQGEYFTRRAAGYTSEPALETAAYCEPRKK